MAPILFTIEEGIAIITLNRPDKLNSFNREMGQQLQSILDECANNDSIRSVYLTGAGKGFCAGQDLAEAIAPGSMQHIIAEQYNPIITRLRKLPKPVLAAVNGVAAGAGANLAFACDIVVAAQSASFIQAFSKLGLVPDSGGTYTLPRLVGWQRASALMMLGDKVSASDAQQMGMVYKVFPDESFEAESKKMALTLAQMPTKGLAYTKHLLNESFNLEQQLTLEDEYQQKAAETEDFKEGINAFLEKRKPKFTGR